jgi:hypothetical protein
MKPRSGFIITVFFTLLITSFSTHAQDRNCRKVDHTIEVRNTTNGQDGTITVSAKDSKQSFTLNLLGKGNGRGTKDNQLNITGTTIRDLKPGKYQLIIHYEDANYCTEVRDVTVN